MKESQVDIEISEREGEKEEKWRRKEKKGRVEDVDKRAKERAWMIEGEKIEKVKGRMECWGFIVYTFLGKLSF